MNVTCPQCSTVYRLPDEKAKPGVKLRCSACRHVFVLPDPEPVLLDTPVDPQSAAAREDAPLSMGFRAEKSGLDIDLDRLPEGPRRSDAPSDGLSMDISAPVPHVGGLDIPASSEDDAASAAKEEEGEAISDQLDMPEQKPSRFEGMGGLILCLAIILGGYWAWNNTAYLDGIKSLIGESAEKIEAPAETAELIKKLELLNVRQYQEKNEKIGNIIVIEGKVKNNFFEAREFIRLEGELLGEDGKVLASRSQLAGTSLSVSQLKLLDKAELESALNSKPGIMASNVNILPGAEVPFMIIFTEIPEGASNFKVRIVEAAAPKPFGNLEK